MPSSGWLSTPHQFSWLGAKKRRQPFEGLEDFKASSLSSLSSRILPDQQSSRSLLNKALLRCVGFDFDVYKVYHFNSERDQRPSSLSASTHTAMLRTKHQHLRQMMSARIACPCLLRFPKELSFPAHLLPRSSGPRNSESSSTWTCLLGLQSRKRPSSSLWQPTLYTSTM